MIDRIRHPSSSRAVVRLAFAIAIAIVLTAGGAALAGARSTGTGATGAGAIRSHRQSASASRYPAGASRPLVHVRAGTLARLAAARRRAAAHAPRHPHRKPAKPVLRGNPARALIAYQAMQNVYYLQSSALYAGEPFAYLWPFSQALAATVSLAGVPALARSMTREVQARLVGLQSYLDPNNSGDPEGTYASTLPAFDGTIAPPAGPGGPKYYDDNDWVGIELVRMYKLTHNPTALAQAEAIMAFEIAGWQTSPELGCGGGIPFSNSIGNTDRNTVTTAPAAELGVQLYRLTGNQSYLAFAEQAYAWVRTCLLQPNALYADHVSPQGVAEATLWSYNQGTMIGAGTLLYQATGNPYYLLQARQTANAALAYFTPETLGAEIPFFPAVYFRNLLYLDSVTHERSGRAVVQAYVNYAWQNLRLSNNVFVAGSPPSGQLLVQSAIVQMYALLSSSPSTYF